MAEKAPCPDWAYRKFKAFGRYTDAEMEQVRWGTTKVAGGETVITASRGQRVWHVRQNGIKPWR